MTREDQLTAIATAAEQAEAIAKQLNPAAKAKLQAVVGDLNRMVLDLQKGE